MSSLLSGYEYDIFISYRQKDNKYDGWVTDFVSNLKKELEATFKEDVSIYFDENPHDGLLETHDVNKSLERKLKCLIFIPIISQTYCDTRSFAWQHEFCAFNKFAKEDALGRDIVLGNGNVSSRILPVKIHDLDAEDQQTLEQETGGTLRAIEFIYKEPGVNRPLKSVDQRNENQNKTDYRNQVNKVANAIKDLVQAIRTPIEKSTATLRKAQPLPGSGHTWKIVWAALILASIIITIMVIQPKESNSYRIAVLPFHNKTGRTDLDPYGIGMASTARSILSTSDQFASVSSLTAALLIDAASSKSFREIGNELGVDHLLTGFYQMRGEHVRLEMELIEVSNEKVKWVIPVDWDMKDLNQLERMIIASVSEKLSIREDNIGSSTSNPDAYAYFQRGQALLKNAYGDSTNGTDAFTPIIEQHAKAVALDSMFIDAWTEMIAVECFLYQGRGRTPETKTRIESHLNTFLKLFPEDSWQKNLVQGEFHFRVKQEQDLAIAFLMKTLETNPNNEHAVYALSNLYARKLMLREALTYAVRLIHINRSSGGHWINLGMLLSQANDPVNGMRALLKGFDLSNSTNFARYTLYQAIGTGYPLNQLPETLKKRIDSEYHLWTRLMARDWPEAKKLSTRSNDRYMTAVICRELNEMDSARYWCKLAIRNAEADSTLYYELTGNREKALAYSLAQIIEPTEESKLEKRTLEIMIAIPFGDFEGATQLLEAMIRDYPELDVWSQYHHSPFFDKIRLEYAPFRELTSRPAPKPLVNIEELISF